MFQGYRDLKGAYKLTAGFGVVCVLLVVAIALGLHRLAGSQTDLARLATTGMGAATTSLELGQAFERVRLDVADVAAAPAGEAADAALEALNTDDAALDTAWATYLDADPASTPEQRQAYEDGLADYRQARDEQTLPLARAGDAAASYASRQAVLTPSPRT